MGCELLIHASLSAAGLGLGLEPPKVIPTNRLLRALLQDLLGEVITNLGIVVKLLVVGILEQL